MMKTMLFISKNPVIAVPVIIGVIILLVIVGWKIFDGSLEEMLEALKIEKQTFKVLSVKFQGGFLVTTEEGVKLIPNRSKVQYVEKQEEMRLEREEVIHCYVQKRWLHKDKLWYSSPDITYKLYVLREKIEYISD